MAHCHTAGADRDDEVGEGTCQSDVMGLAALFNDEPEKVRTRGIPRGVQYDL
jgi:hypothetical protein